MPVLISKARIPFREKEKKKPTFNKQCNQYNAHVLYAAQSNKIAFAYLLYCLDAYLKVC